MCIHLLRPLFLTAALTLPLAACNDDNKSDADTNAACTPGEQNCECNAGQCLGSLQCVAGMCENACIPGELGCECNAGQCLGGLECAGNLCRDPNCTPGELACECNNGLCLGDLQCVGNVCLGGSGDGDGDQTGDGDGDQTGDGDGDQTGDGDGDQTGDGDGEPECPNANEMMCNGQCIDVMDDDKNCGGCGIECGVSNDGVLGGCTAGQCDPFWSDCYQPEDGFTTCDQICGNEDKSCVFNGCGGYTVVEGGGASFCIAKNLGGTKTMYLCDQNLVWQQTRLMCCCQ